MQYYNFALVFLWYLRVSPTDCQTLPYSLTKTGRDANSNTLTLQCTDNSGSVVSNAVFYRNGVLNTSDDCFNSSASVTTNKLRFTISPKCDGHYMCGARSGDGVVLSKPITIHAYPVPTGIDRNIVGEEGRSITLPCDFERSPINFYTTKWFQLLGSLTNEIATYKGEIRDLVIKNLRQINKGLYRCQLRPLDGTNAFNGPFLNLSVNTTYRSPIITTGLIIVNNSDGSSELRVITTGSNLQYQWSINNTVVTGTTQRVVKKDERHLKLNGRWNGTLKVEYLVWNNDYNGIRHERRQMFVVSPYYIGCSSDIKVDNDTSHQKKVIIAMTTVLIISLPLNVVFCIILIIITCCCTGKKKEQEESTSGCVRCRVQAGVSTLQEQQPSLTTQLSTISNSKEIQCIRVLRQVSHGEASVTLSNRSETIYMKRTTSENSSASSETKYANPMSNILVEVAQSISNFEHTDIELLNSLAIILQRVIRLAQLQECHAVLRQMSIRINEQIENIKYNVPTATLMKRYFSDSVVGNKRPQPSDTGYQGLEEQSSSTNQNEVYVADNAGNDQLPLHSVNSNVQTDDHEPQQNERELTKEEKEDLMEVLNVMSSQLEPFLKME